jgi:hypothetical protein
MTVRLPTGVARMLALYSKLIARLRSHAYTRLLRAGLLMWESMAPHERSEWYSKEDLANVKQEVSKVLGEASTETLNRDSLKAYD